jgi:hypothetical protein
MARGWWPAPGLTRDTASGLLTDDLAALVTGNGLIGTAAV